MGATYPTLVCTRHTEQFLKTSTESLTQAPIKPYEACTASAPPTSFLCSLHSSHAGLLPVPTPGPLHMQFLSWDLCMAFHVTTSRRHPSVLITNTLDLWPLDLLMAMTSNAVHQQGPGRVLAPSHCGSLCLCFFMSWGERQPHLTGLWEDPKAPRKCVACREVLATTTG